MTDPQRPENEQPGQYDDQINAARKKAEEGIDRVISDFAKKIPGGEQFEQQAKDMAGGALNVVQDQARKHSGNILGQAGNILSRLFGGGRGTER